MADDGKDKAPNVVPQPQGFPIKTVVSGTGTMTPPAAPLAATQEK